MGGYRILSLDGGGCRGVVTAVLIEELYRRVPGFVGKVDLFAGTSIGAANAVALASRRHDPAKMSEFYLRHGKDLFSERYRPPGVMGAVFRALHSMPLIGGVVSDVAELFLPKWSNRGLEKALEEYFGRDATLGELDPRRVVLLTMALSGRLADVDVVLPVAITNFPGSPDRTLELRRALLRSMSAPVFFPSTSDGYVDGGIFANNPSLVAVAAAAAEDEGGVSLDEVCLLSIGTGISGDAIRTRGRPLTWGRLEWATRFSDVTLRGESESDHLLCEKLLRKRRYCRLNVTLPPGRFAMDDPHAIPELMEIAEAAVEGPDFQRAVGFLHAHFT